MKSSIYKVDFVHIKLTIHRIKIMMSSSCQLLIIILYNSISQRTPIKGMKLLNNLICMYIITSKNTHEFDKLSSF